MRDLHPALSKSNAPAQLAFRQLSRFQRDLVQEMVVRIPAYLSQELVVTLPLADFEAGINLTTLLPDGWKDLLEGECRYSASGASPHRKCPAAFIPYEVRKQNHQRPAFTFQSNVLYLLGCANDYSQFDQFILAYTGAPPQLTAASSTFVVPDDAQDYLAYALAAFHLKRMVGQPAFNVDAETAALYMSDAATARAQFLKRIFQLSQRQSYSVRDVTPY